MSDTIASGTSGPWLADGPDEFGDFNIVPAGHTLAVAAVVSNLRPSDEVEANARLVSAAPDLLAVAYGAPILSMFHGQQGFDYDGFVAAYEIWMATRRAAIAKAEARS